MAPIIKLIIILGNGEVKNVQIESHTLVVLFDMRNDLF